MFIKRLVRQQKKVDVIQEEEEQVKGSKSKSIKKIGNLKIPVEEDEGSKSSSESEGESSESTPPKNEVKKMDKLLSKAKLLRKKRSSQSKIEAED